MIYYSPSTGGFYDTTIFPADSLPTDIKEIAPDVHQQLTDSGKNIVADANGYPTLAEPSPPTLQQLVDDNKSAIQAELDRQAIAKGYDNINACAKYACLPAGAPFQAECAAFLLWCANTWQQAYTYLAQVEAGTHPMPTPAEAVAMMPALVLPS